jgi:hypothetical protein
MMEAPLNELPSPGEALAADSDLASSSGGVPDYADFAKYFDHYLPRVLGFAHLHTTDSAAAQSLTEAILAEAVRAGTPLKPGRAADEALLNAARRVGVRDETGTNSRNSRESG